METAEILTMIDNGFVEPDVLDEWAAKNPWDAIVFASDLITIDRLEKCAFLYPRTAITWCRAKDRLSDQMHEWCRRQ